jgi:NADH:ubiquinone oxidoreductase subunit E
MMGREQIKETFERETEPSSVRCRKTASLACLTLLHRMNDQEPSAIINGKVFTNLTPFRVKELVRACARGRMWKN